MNFVFTIFIAFYTVQVAVATRQPDESIWDVVDNESRASKAVYPLGTFSTKSVYYEGDNNNGGSIVQKLAYNVNENTFGPAFIDGNGLISAIFNGIKQTSHFRVMRDNVLQGYNISCLTDFTDAWNTPEIIFQYHATAAVLVEGRFIGNFGSICDNGEICARAYDFDGNKITYKGKTALRENVCFIVAMGHKAL